MNKQFFKSMAVAGAAVLALAGCQAEEEKKETAPSLVSDFTEEVNGDFSFKYTTTASADEQLFQMYLTFNNGEIILSQWAWDFQEDNIDTPDKVLVECLKGALMATGQNYTCTYTPINDDIVGTANGSVGNNAREGTNSISVSAYYCPSDDDSCGLLDDTTREVYQVPVGTIEI